MSIYHPLRLPLPDQDIPPQFDRLTTLPFTTHSSTAETFYFTALLDYRDGFRTLPHTHYHIPIIEDNSTIQGWFFILYSRRTGSGFCACTFLRPLPILHYHCVPLPAPPKQTTCGHHYCYPKHLQLLPPPLFPAIPRLCDVGPFIS